MQPEFDPAGTSAPPSPAAAEDGTAADGPLAGTRIVEVAGIGPGPYAAMLLGDLGADVVRVERPGSSPHSRRDPTLRNRRSLCLDLKNAAAVEVLLRLIERSDALIEGFRPGVAERLGFGPDVCLDRNPRLVYGRITGWGQEGPLALRAGHDINYIALSGLLQQIGVRGRKPVPPFNVAGDYGGGGMLLAFGIACALFERERSGRGQVVDAAMVDGAASLLAPTRGLRYMGLWRDAPGENFLSGAAHFYDTYETRDGKWVAVGAIEPQFHREMLRRLGLDPADFCRGEGLGGAPYDELVDGIWPALKLRLAEAIRRRTRDELEQLFEGTDACVTPVLGLDEAPRHPHHAARGTYIEVGGVAQNAPAPRFSRSVPATPRPPRRPGEDASELLVEIGFAEEEIEALRHAGALGSA
jgi:alpha-methylacyl-CoA racemase